MQKVLTAEQMREVDRQTTEKYGIPSILLMENAAHAAARVIAEKLDGSVAGKSFLILCGKGNNGGDGAALARILWTFGADVDLYLFGKIKETKGDAKVNFESVKRIALAEALKKDNFCFEEVSLIDYWIHTTGFEINKFDVLVDALFGTGLTRPFDSLYKPLAQICSNKIYLQNALLFSLDVPSGLNADSAESIGENFQADLTVTFTAPKLANVFPPASNFNGELVVANIGSPQELIDAAPSQTYVAEKEDARNWLYKTRVKNDSYKKTRGTALIIAGSKSYSGAAVLAANACFAAGAGMVSVGVPQSVRATIAAKVFDEIIVRGFAETENGAFGEEAAEDVLRAGEKMDVLAVGCGLTSDAQSTRNFVRRIVENRRTPIVVDADGLNALAPFDLSGSDDLPIVLTPHIGEFQRLVGESEIKDRIDAARAFASKHNVILLLKGERSIVAAPDGRVVINPTGNAGISRAGSGDTLTGIITSFLAQTFAIEEKDVREAETNSEKAFSAVVAALYVAGLAGDIAAEKFGQRFMSATDVRDCLSEAIMRVNDREKINLGVNSNL